MSNSILGNLPSGSVGSATAQLNAILDDLSKRVPKVVSAAPTNPVSATGKLTLTGTVADGETATIGGSIYEIDTDGNITAGNVAVDVSASATASQGTLTVDTQPSINDAMTIGGRGYVFVADGSDDQPGEISIGTDLATAQANIVAAINGTDGHNVANPDASIAAFAANAAVITAAVPGVAGDSIVTTENFTAGTNVFDAATLGTTTAGADCPAADAETALVSAINGDSAAVVTAAPDGGADAVDVTGKAGGVADNTVATTESITNASWGAATLENGVDGVAGGAMEQQVKDLKLYTNVSNTDTSVGNSNWHESDLVLVT